MLRNDHVIPREVIRRVLLASESLSSAWVREVLARWCIGSVITIEEDRRLTQEGLRSKMPDDWDGEDVWSRYLRAGIEWCQPEPGSD